MGTNKTTLLVMAAGMGSRFGGLKQIEGVGPNGEIIIDYSVYDAKMAGFDKAVFIIKKEMESEFREIAGRRIEKLIDVDYAFQTMENMPEGRIKPWGTSHAVLCAEKQVDTPFLIINADDFYGRSAYKTANDFLKNESEYGMIGFMLQNTVSEHGTVARGVCVVEDDYLKSVTEHLAIPFDNDFAEDTIVSMNMWACRENLFGYLREDFNEFLKERGNEPKSECLIPVSIDNLIKSGKERVKVLKSQDRWYGVTYRNDMPIIMKAINEFTEKGMYDFK